MLDPDVVLHADLGPSARRARFELHGVDAVVKQARAYSQLGLVIRPALVNGAAGVVTFRDGEPFSVGAVTVKAGRIVEIDFLADPERLRQVDLTVLDG